MILSYFLTLMLVFLIILISTLSNWSLFVDFYILELGSLTMSFSFLMEKYNMMFVLTVLLIFSMVFLYSFSYLMSEIYLKRFLGILTLFVFSMLILITSSSMYSSLVGWDGLGVTSLFLILFYYSKSALKASTLTFLMNRVGDCFFILALTQILLSGEVHICYSCSSFVLSVTFLLILTSITKSAQIPFSTWLPAAMEAPTPVSALVHSSTLVTAGIFLLYRFSVIWIDSPLKNLLLILSTSTCFMASLSALVENDLKKLIALSTLSQLGFIMMSLSLGMLLQGFLHMLMHAYFKALLFMCAGMVIHSFKGSQSITNMSVSKTQNPLLMTIMSCSTLSMSGIPFLSGFYSKDLILDSLKSSASWSTVILFLIVVSFLCTIMYSVRIFWYLLNSSSNWHSMSDGDLGMIKPMIPLALLASLGGSTVTWLVEEENLYMDTSKTMMLIFLGTIVMTYWCLSEVKTSFFLEKKWNLETFNPQLSSLFFQTSSNYKHSSDLLGVPEILNLKVKSSFYKSSKKVMKTMVHYSGSSEFLLFLAVMMLLL